MNSGEHRFTIFRVADWYIAIELHRVGEPMATQHWVGWGKSSYEAIEKLCKRIVRETNREDSDE